MQIPSFVCSGTMVTELCEFNNNKKKKKKIKNTMDKMQNWPKSGSLMKYLVHRLLLTCFVL